MAIFSEVYLKCDSVKCNQKVTYEMPITNPPVSEDDLARILEGVAIDSGWYLLALTPLSANPERWLFHSAKCVRDYLVLKCKMEIQEGKKDGQ